MHIGYTTTVEVTYPLESQAGATDSGGAVSGTYDPIIHIITTEGSAGCVVCESVCVIRLGQEKKGYRRRQ